MFGKNKEGKRLASMKSSSERNKTMAKSNERQFDPNESLHVSTAKSIPIDDEQEAHIKPKPTNSSIMSYVKDFLRRQDDCTWFMTQSSRLVRSDHFQSVVVHSTFPRTLSPEDFHYYIDTTFSDFSEDLKLTMKRLYSTNSDSPVLEEVTCVNDVHGSMTLILIQIITQINDHNELEMLVGSVSCTRHLFQDYRLRQEYWHKNKDRIKAALQYIFGNEAEKELAQRN